MELKGIVKRARRFSKLFCVTDGASFRLKDVDPGDTLDLSSEDKRSQRSGKDDGGAGAGAARANWI